MIPNIRRWYFHFTLKSMNPVFIYHRFQMIFNFMQSPWGWSCQADSHNLFCFCIMRTGPHDNTVCVLMLPSLFSSRFRNCLASMRWISAGNVFTFLLTFTFFLSLVLCRTWWSFFQMTSFFFKFTIRWPREAFFERSMSIFVILQSIGLSFLCSWIVSKLS